MAFEFIASKSPLPVSKRPSDPVFGHSLGEETPRLSRVRSGWSSVPDLARDIAFLRYFGVDDHSLRLATRRADRLGVMAHGVLIADDVLTASQYLSHLGRYLDAPVVGDFAPDPATVLGNALKQGWCRGRLAGGQEVLVVAAQGAMIDVILTMSATRRRGCIVLITPCDFREVLRRHFAERIAGRASASLPTILSARIGANRIQLSIVEVSLAGFIAACLFAPDTTRLLTPLFLGLFFLLNAVVVLAATCAGASTRKMPVHWQDADLPQYSVLVPMYREEAVVGPLLAALDRFDYPTEKLQILLVLEEEDRQTQEAVARLQLPAHVAVFIAPPGMPRTKPRATNAALPFVTGDYVVVYDAEDRPDPYQLRAAVAAFATAGADVGCLQARLAIDNTEDSWLRRLFTIEYAALFDVVKAGTARLRLPVPLGGTSNHFRTSTLKKIGGWDAWNVTEDADLGMRLARQGYYVVDLPSTTDEEAPNQLGAWMKQRTRWLKGWMQTIITHSREPLVCMKAMGVMPFLAAIAVSSGVVLGALGAPLFLILLSLRLLFGDAVGSGDLIHQCADAVMFLLFFTGVVTTFVPAILGIKRRRMLHLWPWLLALPAYQMLVSLAAWLALVELVRAPFRWNKTTHGKARTSRAAKVLD